MLRWDESVVLSTISQYATDEHWCTEKTSIQINIIVFSKENQGKRENAKNIDTPESIWILVTERTFLTAHPNLLPQFIWD
jgi:hypothetical protein